MVRLGCVRDAGARSSGVARADGDGCRGENVDGCDFFDFIGFESRVEQN